MRVTSLPVGTRERNPLPTGRPRETRITPGLLAPQESLPCDTTPVSRECGRPRSPACLLAVAACGDDTTEPAIAPTSAARLQHNLPSYAQMRDDLKTIVAGQNGGFGFHMWAAIVDRDGFVLDVLFSGDDRDSEWPGSRAIAAQKANTANSFSLDNFALSSGNLYAPTQPGGSLFGLQESNPVDPQVAYDGNPKFYGTAERSAHGQADGRHQRVRGRPGLYAADGTLLGGIGLSGDTSCTDHIIAWQLRHALNLDNVPAGVGRWRRGRQPGPRHGRAAHRLRAPDLLRQSGAGRSHRHHQPPGDDGSDRAGVSGVSHAEGASP